MSVHCQLTSDDTVYYRHSIFSQVKDIQTLFLQTFMQNNVKSKNTNAEQTKETEQVSSQVQLTLSYKQEKEQWGDYSDYLLEQEVKICALTYFGSSTTSMFGALNFNKGLKYSLWEQDYLNVGGFVLFQKKLCAFC